MPETVPFLDLVALHKGIADQLTQGFRAAVDSAGFIGGRAVADFEAAYAKYCARNACVGVANGTDALMLSLKVLGIGPGDAVLLPAFTFIATAEAVTMLGAEPRFVDVDDMTYTMDPKCLAAADRTRVKAVIPVHLYGQPADMDPILALAKAQGWRVLEDAAQAHGAQYHDRPVGSFGDFAGFSFYPGKNLGALGDGGAVVGDAGDAMDRLRRLADHGRISKYEHGEPGVNSRLDAVQATALTIKLAHLGDWNAQRARVAAWYDARFEGVDGIITPKVAPGRTHVFHLYVVRVHDREKLREHLAAANVQSGVHYPVPLHLQPAFKSFGFVRGAFPVSEAISDGCLSLPIFPSMTEAQVDRVASLTIEHVRAGS